MQSLISVSDRPTRCRLRRRIAGFMGFAAVAMGLYVTAAPASDVHPVRPEMRPTYAEYEIKAAILFNIAKLVHWPDAALGSHTNPIVIGILGRNPFGAALTALEQRKLRGRPIRTVLFSTPDDVLPCHVLYVNSNDPPAQLAALQPVLGMQPTLTVGEIEGFARQGGIVELATVDDRPAFRINMSAARRAALEIDAALLKLAATVYENPVNEETD